MAETEETKAAIEYWDRVAATSKRRAAQETVERNLDRAEERQARERPAEISQERWRLRSCAAIRSRGGRVFCCDCHCCP